MQGRTVILTGINYRYGFNTQENDDEVKGQSNSMGAEFWEYDARSGRRWNVDPKSKAYESPYAAFGNSPIWLTDANGADTTLPAADGKNITLPTGASFETFHPNTNYNLPSNGKKIDAPVGSLKSFTIDDNTYNAVYNIETLKFAGYQDVNGKSVVQENNIPSLNTVDLFAQSSLRYNFGVRLNEYLNPLAETRDLFNNNLISANAASEIRYNLTLSSRKLLDPIGKAFSGGLKSEQTAWRMYQNFLQGGKDAASIFKTNPWVNGSARFFSKVPVLQITLEGISYYSIISQKKSIDQVEKEYDNWGNPIFKFYRNVIEKPLRKLGEK